MPFPTANTFANLPPPHPTPCCRLAQKLVVSKVRAAVPIRKCVVSGGGSLAGHLDDFFEVRWRPM